MFRVRTPSRPAHGPVFGALRFGLRLMLTYFFFPHIHMAKRHRYKTKSQIYYVLITIFLYMVFITNALRL